MRKSSRLLLFSGGTSYRFVNSEAADLIARYSNTPATTWMRTVDTLIGAEKTAGVYSIIDAQWWLGSPDAQSAKLNWQNTNFTLTEVNGPTHTPYRGYQGDASTKYLRTGFIPSTAGGALTLTSGHIGVWSRTNSSEAGIMMGARDGGSLRLTDINPRSVAGSLFGRLSQNSGNNGFATASSLGHFVTVRRGDDLEHYHNGVSIGTETVTAAGLTVRELYMLCNNNGGAAAAFSSRQALWAHVGGELSSAQVLALYNAGLAAANAIGA